MQAWALDNRKVCSRTLVASVLLSLAHISSRAAPSSAVEVALAKPSCRKSTPNVSVPSSQRVSEDERDHRQQRPFESISLQVARTAVKMPSEQGHRLYVKYVHTEIPPSRGGISKSRITDIAQPCDGTMEGPHSTAHHRRRHGQRA